MAQVPNHKPRANRPAAVDAPTEVANTIRLGGNELVRLQAELDAPGSGPVAEFDRSHHRWEFRLNSIRVDVIHPGGAVVSLQFACRNLSASGVSLLHSAYVHVGTAVVIHVPRADGALPARGKVVRCRHYKGKIHEIGIRFDRAIEIREVLDIDPLQGKFSVEHVSPDELQGTLLHVEDSAVDRRLVRHYLKETQLNVVSVETIEEAVKRSVEGFDVVLADYSLPGGSGADLCITLRQANVRGPIILCSADTSAEVRAGLQACQADAFLAKPFSKQLLLRALAEFMLASRLSSDRSGLLYSSLPPDDPNYSLVADFVEETHALGAALVKALEAQQIEEVSRFVLQVKSGASSLAFDRLAQSADAALNALRSGGLVGGSVLIRQLAAMCNRTASVRARHGSGKAA